MTKAESRETRVESRKEGSVRRRFVASCETRVAGKRRGNSLFCAPKPETRNSKLRNPNSQFRDALTLIELMVVIVILMTLVGGVIPVLSPNNEARKIREASRGLQTYIMQAQARAARTGRPAGIGFHETSAGSGVALEVFQIEVPPPFAGFSSSSAARFYRNLDSNGIPKGNYTIELGEGYLVFNDQVGYVPPALMKPNDLIEVGGHLFLLKRGRRGTEWELDENEIPYFLGTNKFTDAWRIGEQGRPFPRDPNSPTKSSPKSYRVLRQPVNTSESPLTLPAGVAIDMHASGTEGGSTPTLFASNHDVDVIKQIGILFSPNGAIDSVYYNNGEIFGPNAFGDLVQTPLVDTSRVFLLLGRVENVLDRGDMHATKNKSPAWIDDNASDEELAELQERINWLNLDSRWVVCDTRSGRSVVNDNAFVDPRRINYQEDNDLDKRIQRRWMEMDEARKFAKQMKSDGGS